MKFRDGVFTPWASVLCASCHNELPEERRTFRGSIVTLPEEEVELRAGNEVCTCETCGTEIVVREDVALLRRLQVFLKERGLESSIEQTGGMNVALSVGGWPDEEDKVTPFAFVTSFMGEALLEYGVYESGWHFTNDPFGGRGNYETVTEEEFDEIGETAAFGFVASTIDKFLAGAE